MANCRVSLSLGRKVRGGGRRDVRGKLVCYFACFQMKQRIIGGGGGRSDVFWCTECHQCVELQFWGGGGFFFPPCLWKGYLLDWRGAVLMCWGLTAVVVLEGPTFAVLGVLCNPVCISQLHFLRVLL